MFAACLPLKNVAPRSTDGSVDLGRLQINPCHAIAVGSTTLRPMPDCRYRDAYEMDFPGGPNHSTVFFPGKSFVLRLSFLSFVGQGFHHLGEFFCGRLVLATDSAAALTSASAPSAWSAAISIWGAQAVRVCHVFRHHDRGTGVDKPAGIRGLMIACGSA